MLPAAALRGADPVAEMPEGVAALLAAWMAAPETRILGSCWPLSACGRLGAEADAGRALEVTIGLITHAVITAANNSNIRQIGQINFFRIRSRW